MKILQESEVQLKARGGKPGSYLSSLPIPSYANPMNAQYAQVVQVPVGSYVVGAPGQYSQANRIVPTNEVLVQPANYQPVNYQPANYQPANYQPANYQPANHQPANYQPANYQPANYQPANYQPANYQPANYAVGGNGSYEGLPNKHYE